MWTPPIVATVRSVTAEDGFAQEPPGEQERHPLENPGCCSLRPKEVDMTPRSVASVIVPVLLVGALVAAAWNLRTQRDNARAALAAAAATSNARLHLDREVI